MLILLNPYGHAAPSGVVFQCNVFQNNVFQGPCAVVTPPPVVGPNLVPGGPGLSRKKFYEIWEAMIAAQERARELKSKRATAKLKKVGDTAQFFANIERAAIDARVAAQLRALENALIAAASAGTLTRLLAQTDNALAQVRLIRQEMDEEEMLALILDS